ncbi:hypothetical protein UNH65_08885 [Chitinophaga sp. 180180018-2]|nr:hypothetical protein [Chitinophaga sp. 212800010-3]
MRGQEFFVPVKIDAAGILYPPADFLSTQDQADFDALYPMSSRGIALGKLYYYYRQNQPSQGFLSGIFVDQISEITDTDHFGRCKPFCILHSHHLTQHFGAVDNTVEKAVSGDIGLRLVVFRRQKL